MSSPTIKTAALTSVYLSQTKAWESLSCHSLLFLLLLERSSPLPPDILVEGLSLFDLSSVLTSLYLLFCDNNCVQNTHRILTEPLEQRSLYFRLPENHSVLCRERKVQAPIFSVFSCLWFPPPTKIEGTAMLSWQLWSKDRMCRMRRTDWLIRLFSSLLTGKLKTLVLPTLILQNDKHLGED